MKIWIGWVAARLRLLPIVIVAAALMFVFKVGEVWRDAEPILAGLGVGAVLAQEQEAEEEAADEEEAEVAADEETEEGEADEGEALPELAVSEIPSFSQVEVDLLQELRARRDTLDTRDRAQDLRERLLEAAEARIDEKIAELKAIEDTIRALLVQHDEEKEEAMRRLVKMYENMKPKDAARIFTELDMEILLDVAERMREVKMAPILAAMAATRAEQVTVKLALRRKLPDSGG